MAATRTITLTITAADDAGADAAVQDAVAALCAAGNYQAQLAVPGGGRVDNPVTPQQYAGIVLKQMVGAAIAKHKSAQAVAAARAAAEAVSVGVAVQGGG